MTLQAVKVERDDPGTLIERARGGDIRAFEALYREHVARVYGLCLRLVRNRATAEDCTQQTFINAWSALSRFESRSAFATWLHRIAVNVATAYRRASHLQVADVHDSQSGELQDNLTFDVPVEASDLEAAIRALPDGARHVLVLSGIYGYSHAEVADMLGIAAGTCKAQLHRARKLLREKLNLEQD